MISPAVSAYLQKRGVRSWNISGLQGGPFAGAIIIPALAESSRLFHTLQSLTTNPPELLARFLVLVVVNHRQDAPAADKADNEATLRMLAAGDPLLATLQLAWVDAREMPVKEGGVGLARKIGADLALPCLDYAGSDPLLVYLDADTLLEPNYLASVIAHFKESPAGGAVIPFRHRRAPTAAGQQAIDCYELFLRSYVLGLEIAGSPYAFHTVGSAMTCRAVAYARMGGMNCRAAGEDFYFLQQLHRTSGVAQLQGTVVHPSPRASHRVPFGTGRSMSRVLAGDTGAIVFHRSDCFTVLRDWLQVIANHLGADAEVLVNMAKAVSPELAMFLDQNRFTTTWDKLQQNSPNARSLHKAFHDWFDGLKTMRLIHHLSDTVFPVSGPEHCVHPLLSLAGEEQPETLDDQLKLLQRRQLALSDRYFTD